MATWVHKGEESKLITAESLQGHLKNGWSVDKPGEEKQGEQQDLSKLKVDELKALAEQAGIEGFDDMKKAQLVEALTPVEDSE